MCHMTVAVAQHIPPETKGYRVDLAAIAFLQSFFFFAPMRAGGRED